MARRAFRNQRSSAILWCLRGVRCVYFLLFDAHFSFLCYPRYCSCVYTSFSVFIYLPHPTALDYFTNLRGHASLSCSCFFLFARLDTQLTWWKAALPPCLEHTTLTAVSVKLGLAKRFARRFLILLLRRVFAGAPDAVDTPFIPVYASLFFLFRFRCEQGRAYEA